jgi:L-ascorbate metabolism protein UlaG (beta-lactamase superfamily)
MYLLLLLFVFFVVFIWIFLHQKMFGKLPTGDRLKKIQSSPNYHDGSFQNKNFTPQLTEGASYSSVLSEFLFKKKLRRRPLEPLPSQKTNLFKLAVEKNVLVWFGHSSYFLQVDGKKFLVDPVLSGSASPLPGGTKAFSGSDIYKPTDIPAIDFLIITHDHWDHLDYKTIKAIQPKIGKIICPLGVGEHLEYWGYNVSCIIEKDWEDAVKLAEGFKITLQPARHFAGRTLKRNTSLWTSYVLQTPSLKIFIGGDSGFDTHFAEIGKTHGPFDLAILENGQYDKSWRYIHLLPDEIIPAAIALKAKTLMPVHSSKFGLGNHPWDEPLRLLYERTPVENLEVITPMIGEMVALDDPDQKFGDWWSAVK